MTVPRIVLSFPLFALACTAPEPAPVRFTLTDSSGVAIARSSAPRDSAGAWRLGDTPSLAIGDGEDAAIILLKVDGATRLGDGRLAILNGDPPGILIVDRDGQLVRTVGRSGEGPGEFWRPQSLWASGDSLVVWDAMMGPRTIFDTTGQLRGRRTYDLSRIRAGLGDSISAENHIPFGVSGTIVQAGPHRPDLSEIPNGEYRGNGAVFFFDDANLTPTTLGRASTLQYRLDEGLHPVLVPSFYFIRTIVTPNERVGTAWIADGTTPAVDEHATDGRLLRRIEWTAEPERLSDEEYDSSKTWWLGVVRELFGVKDPEQLLKQLPDQHFFAPVLGMVVDNTGGLWVRAGIRQWKIFGPDGEWLGRIDLPFRKLYEVGEDYVLGLHIDDDGIESVREYPLIRP